MVLDQHFLNKARAAGGDRNCFVEPKAVMRHDDIMSPPRGFTLLVCSHTETSQPRVQFFAPPRGLSLCLHSMK